MYRRLFKLKISRTGAMEIDITTFVNPFSFFFTVKDEHKVSHNSKLNITNNTVSTSLRPEVSDKNHGRYVAVWFENKWARGVICMSSQFRIWLIDYGFFLRPDEKTVYIDLPPEYKTYPSKVVEASIHGVVPVNKTLTFSGNECEITSESTLTWIPGATEKAHKLLKEALNIYFVPVMILSTKNNDIVLGDLYLNFHYHGKYDNIIELLSLWPAFLEVNKEAYIKNLPIYYANHRSHYACSLPPELPDFVLKTVTLEMTIVEYSAICANIPKVMPEEHDLKSLDGSTVVDAKGIYKNKKKKSFRLTPSEIEEYSNMYIKINGVECNVLQVLLNKIRDLNMCEHYKDHDLKSIGRGVTRRSGLF